MHGAGDFGGTPVFCSWSGGKDSALALHEAARAGAEPRLLVSMMVEGGERSRSHGLSREVLAAQAEAVGLPIEFGAASWSGDEAELIRHCKALIANYKCPRSVAFATEPLPLSGAGKILKTELRKPYWEGRSKQVN